MADYKIEVLQGSQEVLITRHIYALRNEVYKALTDPVLIPTWWGPDRLTTAVQKMTVMPGGLWRYVQTDKEGKELAFHGVYHDVVINERLVSTSEFEGTPGNVTLFTDQLTEKDGDTIITTHAVFYSVEGRQQKLRWGLEEGVRETTRRLNKLFGKMGMPERRAHIMERLEENGECLTITRTFDAPRDQVWGRWTDPNQYMCWWGPKDFTSPYARFDLRPGGRYLSCMRGPDGKDYCDTGHYQEIDELNRIVYTDSFADESGNPVPPSFYGMVGDQPVEMSVEVRLEDVGGKTRMTLEHCGLTGGEMIDQATEGWNQSFDKLASCLR